MDCSRVRDAFAKGVVLSSRAVQDHLDGCPQCAALFERDAELGRALATQVSPELAFPEDLFGEVEARVARETGLRAWLRSRPSRLRFQLIALCVVLLLALAGGMRQRPDLSDYPTARVVLLLGGYFVAILLAVGKELSLATRRGIADHFALVLGALAVPFLAALVPATEASRHTGAAGALNCFIYGALFTLPVGILLWAFDRDDRPSLRTVGLSAAALGLSGNLLLELHCPSGHPLHLLLGHASLGLAWFAAWFAMRSVYLRK